MSVKKSDVSAVSMERNPQALSELCASLRAIWIIYSKLVILPSLVTVGQTMLTSVADKQVHIY